MNINLESNEGYFSNIFKQIMMNIDNNEYIEVKQIPHELNEYLQLLYKYN